MWPLVRMYTVSSSCEHQGSLAWCSSRIPDGSLKTISALHLPKSHKEAESTSAATPVPQARTIALHPRLGSELLNTLIACRSLCCYEMVSLIECIDLCSCSIIAKSCWGSINCWFMRTSHYVSPLSLHHQVSMHLRTPKKPAVAIEDRDVGGQLRRHGNCKALWIISYCYAQYWVRLKASNS